LANYLTTPLEAAPAAGSNPVNLKVSAAAPVWAELQKYIAIPSSWD